MEQSFLLQSSKYNRLPLYQGLPVSVITPVLPTGKDSESISQVFRADPFGTPGERAGEDKN
jgi:hypothetical protein